VEVAPAEVAEAVEASAVVAAAGVVAAAEAAAAEVAGAAVGAAVAEVAEAAGVAEAVEAAAVEAAAAEGVAAAEAAAAEVVETPGVLGGSRRFPAGHLAASLPVPRQGKRSPRRIVRSPSASPLLTCANARNRRWDTPSFSSIGMLRGRISASRQRA
jgi:hypothetical protein